MTTEEHRRLLEIRKMAKIGQRLSADEQKFCERMFKEWPDEYREMGEYLKRWALHQMNPMAEDPDA